MREGLVGLGHAVGVVLLLDGTTLALGRCDQFGSEAVGHALVATRTGVLNEPTEGERGTTLGPHFDRHLVGGTSTRGAMLLIALRNTSTPGSLVRSSMVSKAP